MVRQWLAGLCERARPWIKEEGNQDEQFLTDAPTAEYIDLIFAFGLARLGDPDIARALLNRAQEVLRNRDEVHRFLLEGYRYRIEQGLQGQPHAGPLPDDY